MEISHRIGLVFFLLYLSVYLASARRISKNELHEKQRAAAKRFSIPTLGARESVKNITFSNPRASG